MLTKVSTVFSDILMRNYWQVWHFPNKYELNNDISYLYSHPASCKTLHCSAIPSTAREKTIMRRNFHTIAAFTNIIRPIYFTHVTVKSGPTVKHVFCWPGFLSSYCIPVMTLRELAVVSGWESCHTLCPLSITAALDLQFSETYLYRRG